MSLSSAESPSGLAPAGPSSAPAAGCRSGSSASKASQVLDPSCTGEVLLKVRWLAHLSQDPSPEEHSDHAAWLLLGLLQGHCLSFHNALAGMPSNARRWAMSHLIIKRFLPDQLLTWSDMEGQAEGIAAALVLKGSLQLLGAGPGEEVELPAGGELSKSRAASGPQGAEVLILLRKSLQEATEREEAQVALRQATREVLWRTETMDRESADLEVLRRYLDTLPLFHDLPDEKLLELCQHLQLFTVEQGECLLRRQRTPADGLRLILQGTAAASVGSSSEPALPLWCHEAWFCEDHAIWPWELFTNGLRVADVVAIEDCDVLFLPHAECATLPIDIDMLRSCFSQMLALKTCGPEEAVLRHRALLVPNAPVIQVQEDYWMRIQQRDRDDSKKLVQKLISTPSLVPQRLPALEGDGGRTSRAGSTSSAQDHPGISTSIQSGVEVASLMRVPSCELEEQDLGLHQAYAYGAIRDWAEAMLCCLLPGLEGALRPLWQLLPRSLRPQLGPSAQLLQLQPGQLLPGNGQAIQVLLRGELGQFEASRDIQLPPALLKALPGAVKRSLRGIPISSQAKDWLSDVLNDHADVEDPVAPGAMSALAETLLQVAQRRFQELKCPGEAFQRRSFVTSAFLDRKLLGEQAVWVEQDLENLAMRRSAGSSHMPETSWLEAYFDISEIGQMTSIHRPGERILAAAKTEFVALKSADILVLDPAALLAASVEESMVMPAVPASKGCNKYSIKELFRLDKLLRQTEAFQHLDCRSMVDLCRSSALHFEALEPGQQICCEGQEATGFFAILEGTASSWSSGAFLLRLNKGNAVGEDVLLEDLSVWPFSVVAETPMEILWVNAKLFQELSLDPSGRRAARRRMLEASDWRLPEGIKDLEAFVKTQKVPVLKEFDREFCYEMLKQASILQIPAGGQVVETLEGDSAPLYIILKGAVGRYALDLPEESTEEVDHSTIPVEQEDVPEQSKELTSKRRRLAKAKEDLAELKSRHRRVAPLDRPMKESLRIHFLTQLVTELSAELLSALPEEQLIDHKVAPGVRDADGHATGANAKVNLKQSAGVFLTAPVEAEQLDESDELEDLLDKALVEYYEGDSFGWEAATAARYVAHQDAALLVVTDDDFQRARELCEAHRRHQRGQFLHRCVGDEDVAARLLPLFREERCHRGTVLAKAGVLSGSLWLILSGSCSQVKEAESKETQSNGRSRRTSLGVLQEGQFVGMTSLLLQQPEPLTVICTTEVQLLRADSLPHAKLTPKVIEVLKRALQCKGAWLSQRLETLTELPSKLERRAERLRRELQEARVPLVSDSPFLRRKHQALLPGMVALEAVCKHFGNEVHPESEWIYMQKERDFFMHMQLSSGFSEPLPKAEIPEHNTKSLGVITSPATANARFEHHQPLLWKKFRIDTSMQAQPRKTTVAVALPPQGPTEGPEPATNLALEEMPIPTATSPVTPRAVADSPEEQFRRRPRIILSSNSRVFQNCSTEVTMNERRAVKEAKSQVSQGSAVCEPLVTPRDTGSRSAPPSRHLQKGFASSKSVIKDVPRGTPPPKSPSPSNPPPGRSSASPSEAPGSPRFPTGFPVTQLVPVTPVDSPRNHRPRRVLNSQQSCRSRTETDEGSLSVDSRMLQSSSRQS